MWKTKTKGLNESFTPLGGMQSTTIINESGLYSHILSSKLPKAREFKHWVTSDDSILIRDLAKLITQNGVKIGRGLISFQYFSISVAVLPVRETLGGNYS